MPIYMDRHNVPGIEAKNAAKAHREDLKVQDKFGCRCMTYWVDEERGNAFCLIDAPNEESVKKMHEVAHGLVPNEIFQVNSNVVEAFLGRIHDPKNCYLADVDLKVFNDPAFRIILVSETKDERLLRQELGRGKASRLVSVYHETMRTALHKHEGREVESTGEDYIASFVSVTQAVTCAIAVQKSLHVGVDLMNIRIAINAGMPVERSKSLFGDTIKLARFLCSIAQVGEIVLAPIIWEIYKDDGQSAVGGKSLIKWISPSDERFLELLMDALEANWRDYHFKIEDFCDQMSMSRSKLFRHTTELTGMSLNTLLREFRLKKSLELLKTNRNVFQTTFDVGFTSPSYFTKCFQKRFGVQPHVYQKDLG